MRFYMDEQTSYERSTQKKYTLLLAESGVEHQLNQQLGLGAQASQKLDSENHHHH